MVGGVKQMAKYVPIMLNCEGQPCVIIGGGEVAERKVRQLAEAGASIHIISPRITEGLSQLVVEGRVSWSARAYQPGDLSGAMLAFAATDNPEVNKSAAEEASGLGIWVNIASSGEDGTFITPAVMRRGRLTVAVSASGAGPLAAVSICRRLEEELGQEIEPYLDFVYEMRRAVKDSAVSPSVRKRLLRKIYEIDILQEIEQGRFIPWTPEQIKQWITDNQEE